MNTDKKHLPVLGYGPHFIIAMALITAIFFYLIRIGKFDKFYFDNNIIKLFGMLFIIVGIIIYALSLVKSRIGTRIKENKLVVDGIYAYVRNPIYSGILYVFTGIILLQKNLTAILLFIIFWIAITIFLKNTEEKWLIAHFGQAYIDYMKRVNRFIIWFK